MMLQVTHPNDVDNQTTDKTDKDENGGNGMQLTENTDAD